MPKKGSETDVIDRQKNLSINDFRGLNTIDKDPDLAPVATADLGAPPIPDLAQVLAAPQPPKLGNTKLVTLAVTDDVPLRDVLFELGRLANVDIEVGPGLDTTGINLRATNRPFNEVIERIAALANLRYSSAGSAIRVEKDTPYLKNYSLDFLNVVRSSSSSSSLSTSLGSSSGGGSSSSSSGSSSSSSSSGSSGSGGSSGSITSSSESDLWSALEASVNEILSYDPSLGGSENANASGGQQAAAGGVAKGSLVINRQASVLSVSATQRQHEMIERFLKLMTRNASAQVLIEAKIVEVSLSDQFASGVNWSHIIGNLQSYYLAPGQYTPSIPGSSSSISTAPGSKVFSMGVDAGDLGAIVSMTQAFGTTRTLSSPRLSAINNQQATLTFAKNAVYFDCKYTPGSQTTGTGSSASTSTQPALDCPQKTIPLGIILNIMPVVNLESQEITLNVKPTITHQVGTATNPQTGFLRSLALSGTSGSAAAAAAIPDITIPVIESREIDSITKVRSGGVMIIGGLMEDVSNNINEGVPGLGELPLLGNMFKSRSEDSSKRELIIFIKATIVNPDGSTHDADRRIYNKFISDPRPLFPQ